MKRLLALFGTLLCAAITAFAQMMPDSTVQVVAYWNVGDKYNFQVEESKYKVSNETDTSAVEKSAHLLTLEVVDATDSTYRVRVTSDDYLHSDYKRDAWQEDLTRQFGNTPYEFETDQYGSFKRVFISDEDMEMVYPMLDAVVEKIADDRDMDAQQRSNMKALMRAMFTKEKILSLYEQEITPLLSFFAIRVTPGEEIHYETSIPSVFGDGSAIRMTGRYWADKELTDDYSVVMHNVMSADPEDMQRFVSVFLGNALDAVNEVDGETRETIDSALKGAEIALVDVVWEEIHLDTGWPLHYEYVRDLLVKAEGEQQEQYQSKTISILLDETEDQN